MSFKTKFSPSLKDDKEELDKLKKDIKETTKHSLVDSSSDSICKPSDKEKNTFRGVDKDDNKFDRIDWSKRYSDEQPPNKFDTIDWSKKSFQTRERDKFDTINWKEPHGVITDNKKKATEDTLNMKITSPAEDRINAKVTDKERNVPKTDEQMATLYRQKGGKPYFRGEPTKEFKEFKKQFKHRDAYTYSTKSDQSTLKINEINSNTPKTLKSEKQPENKATSKSRYKYDISDMRKIAQERGGECLSEKYEGVKTPLNWRCSEGHEWESAPSNVVSKKNWCPECAGHFKYTIKDMQDLARSRDGKCLSEKYIDNKTALKWQCNKGHEWDATPDNVKNQGTWCPDCAGNFRYTIKDMQKLAESRGGKCLSEKYVDATTKLTWQCKKGHEWEATPGSIRNNGTWCPDCAGNIKYTITDMQKLAESRGGKCLSKSYVNAKTNLKWQCRNGHEWEATPNNVKNNESWCPKCDISVFEKSCRQFVEKLFNKKFRKSYPEWLRNQEGNRMHLDGYNKELNVAFEAQGTQHYKFSPHFHKTMKRFLKYQSNDKIKDQLCKKNEVKLIKIPYTIKMNKMEKFIREQVKELGITAPVNTNKIDYKQFKYYTESKLKQMQKLAESRGGKLLSEKYVNAITPLKWQCEKGHTWDATPNNIKNNAKGRGGLKGNWCPECAERKKYTIEDVQAFAHSKGGECLSTKYERAQAPLKWRCEHNHEFSSTFYNVKVKKSWCPECRKDKYLQRYKDIAKERGGKLLSERYINGNTKLQWQCEKGHTWPATPNSIKQGSWCPDCGGQHKYDINDMKMLAKSYGGECLSEKYLGAKEYLNWRCSKGHEWKSTPNNIKNNDCWCPECKKERKKK